MLSGRRPSVTCHAFAWLQMKQCAFSKTVSISRNMSYITHEVTSTLSPCTPTLSYLSARPTSLSSEINPCHDPQQVSIVFSADVPPATLRIFGRVIKIVGLPSRSRVLNNSGSLLSFSQTNVFIKTLQTSDSERVVKCLSFPRLSKDCTLAVLCTQLLLTNSFG